MLAYSIGLIASGFFFKAKYNDILSFYELADKPYVDTRPIMQVLNNDNGKHMKTDTNLNLTVLIIKTTTLAF